MIYLMRFLFIIALFSGLGYGAWRLSETRPEVRSFVESALPSTEFHTLEVRYTAEQIMSSQRKSLLKSNQHKFLESTLCFYPYLLMEVKYCPSSKKTRETVILWDLCDGEMVLETKGWDKTHGFGDCILASTDRHEFKIINFLAKKGGSCDRHDLLEKLHMETPVLDGLIDNLRKKQLIVFSGNKYRLHLQKPKLKSEPETKINERLVTKPRKNSRKIPKRFSLTQIEKLAKAAFGEEFSIRHTSDVYLPVHSIAVQNPDGSIHTTLWNALNGKKLSYTTSID